MHVVHKSQRTYSMYILCVYTTSYIYIYTYICTYVLYLIYIHTCHSSYHKKLQHVFYKYKKKQHKSLYISENIWMFPKMGVPQIIHCNRVFHYKPSILGYPYFRKHPFLSSQASDLSTLACSGSRSQYPHLVVPNRSASKDFWISCWFILGNFPTILGKPKKKRTIINN